MSLVKILSIDGGGIRGMIPAQVVAEIERRTGKRAYELFDLIAGNSTGGIITLGLTVPRSTNGEAPAPLSGEELMRLYLDDGAQIFTRTKRFNPMGLFAPKFQAAMIEKLLRGYYGDYELKDALTAILVPSYDIERRRTVFFKRRNARSNPQMHNFYMRDVARATSAAPTFFPPVCIQSVNAKKESSRYYLVDGGVVANNPSLCALSETNVDPALGGTSRASLSGETSQHNLLLVSIGTGSSTRSLKYRDVLGWGLQGWAASLIDVVFDGTAQAVEYQTECLVPPVNGQQRYFRFQCNLDMASDDIDCTNALNLERLINEGDQLIQNQDKELDQLCELLTSSPSPSSTREAIGSGIKTPYANVPGRPALNSPSQNAI